MFLSVRWKILLGFTCRNRLLLTGTPIQNSMAEVSVCKNTQFLESLIHLAVKNNVLLQMVYFGTMVVYFAVLPVKYRRA